MEAELLIDKRKLKRFIVNVKILDRETNQCLGYSANMHTKGMLITSTDRLPLNKLLKIKLVHIQFDDEVIEIPLNINGLWSKPSNNSDFHNTGFNIVEPTQEQIHAVNSVIEELAI